MNKWWIHFLTCSSNLTDLLVVFSPDSLCFLKDSNYLAPLSKQAWLLLLNAEYVHVSNENKKLALWDWETWPLVIPGMPFPKSQRWQMKAESLCDLSSCSALENGIIHGQGSARTSTGNWGGPATFHCSTPGGERGACRTSEAKSSKSPRSTNALMSSRHCQDQNSLLFLLMEGRLGWTWIGGAKKNVEMMPKSWTWGTEFWRSFQAIILFVYVPPLTSQVSFRTMFLCLPALRPTNLHTPWWWAWNSFQSHTFYQERTGSQAVTLHPGC